MKSHQLLADVFLDGARVTASSSYKLICKHLAARALRK